MAEPIDVDAEDITHAGLVPFSATAAVEPAITAHKATELQQQYVDLCRALLDETDYQAISGKRFPKKSAWRKLAVAFNVSTEKIGEEYVRVGDRARTVTVTVTVRATAPNGRFMDGIGVCDLYERCCPAAEGGVCPKAGWNVHKCCAPDCSGSVHFSNAQHDLPATAMTRATNRACSDLFGMGEVSAEEIGPRQVIYENINGDQIPVAPEVKTTRSGPGADLAKKQKQVYAMCRGANLDVFKTVGGIIGRTIKNTNELTMAECNTVIPALRGMGA